MPTLTVEHLYKSYTTQSAWDRMRGKQPKDKVWALHDVSFTLKPGVYGLLGANGAGKSTLMNILTGTLPATKGKVLWDGVSTQKLDQEYRAILGYMPQQQTLYDGFTGRRFLYYMAALKGLNKQQTWAETERTAKLVNLSSEMEKKLGAYSGGMKQRILAAAALMGKPQLLILDEPTAGLDPKERVHLRNILKAVSQDSIVLIATHVVSDVESIADQVFLLKGGEIIGQGSPKQLEEKYYSDRGLEGVYLSIFGEDEAGCV